MALVIILAFHVHTLRLVPRLQERLAFGEKGNRAMMIPKFTSHLVDIVGKISLARLGILPNLSAAINQGLQLTGNKIH